MFIGRVNDKDFRNKVVITIRLNAVSYELTTPTKDKKILSIKHIKQKAQKKYKPFLKPSEV
jgi:hypothetical protein